MNLTKKFNNRERPLSQDYEQFVMRVLNKGMPTQLRTIYKHYDVKANTKARKKLKEEQLVEMIQNGESVFPYNFLDISAKAIDKTGFFSCKPINSVPMCKVEI